jgi:hypothetical protein
MKPEIARAILSVLRHRRVTRADRVDRAGEIPDFSISIRTGV